MLKGVVKMNDQPVEESMLTDELETDPPQPPPTTTDDSATPSGTIDVPLATAVATTTAAAASVSEEKPMLEPEESELTSNTKNSDILK